MNGIWTPDSDITDKLTRLTDATGAPTGWKYTNSDDETELYDASGKLLSITNRAGLTQTLSYDASGRLASVADPFGRTLTFSYDTSNRISAMTDPAGKLYSYAYDANNNLTSVTYPDGKSRSYLYENTTFRNALTGITDENGVRFATYAYDTQGRAISSEHAGGAEKVSLVYNTNSTTVTDSLGAVRTYRFQTILGVVKNTAIEGPACTSCGANASAATRYDANGNVAARTDFNGNVTTYTYDLTRNLETSRTEASGTPLARTLTTEWHPTFRLPTKITEPNRVTTLVYDASGDLTQKTVTAGTLSRTWRYTYNANGQMTLSDGPRTDATDTTTYVYDSSGNLTTTLNALNQTTQITAYDAHGRPLTVQDPNGLVTNLSYDLRGRLISRSVGGEVTGYQYDGVGNLLKTTLPDGSFMSFTYDAAHRLTQITDQLGNRIVYTLDAMGNRTKEDIFDPTHALTQTRSRVFNQLSRLAQDIGAQAQTTNYQYDNNGNRTAVTDPLNRSTTSSYDNFNRLLQVTDPNNGLTRYSY
ncbi:MAG: RHS repeat protein, partial [Gammaproteobacteria bacterium]|nr:RHS repeat protein [Gammaproteobacteria bacterium]